MHRYTRYVLFSLPAGIVAFYPLCSLLITSQDCRILPVMFSSHYQLELSRSTRCVLFSLSTTIVAFFPLCSLLIINQDCRVLPVVFSSHYQPGVSRSTRCVLFSLPTSSVALHRDRYPLCSQQSRCTEIAPRCVLNCRVVERSLPVVFSTVARTVLNCRVVQRSLPVVFSSRCRRAADAVSVCKLILSAESYGLRDCKDRAN